MRSPADAVPGGAAFRKSVARSGAGVLCRRTDGGAHQTLAKIGELRVVSRTSAMQYKGVHKPLREIARELEVDAIVEGSVLRAGRRVRITAQLIDAPKETHLWAESYERDLRDVLALQAEVLLKGMSSEKHFSLPECQKYFPASSPLAIVPTLLL